MTGGEARATANERRAVASGGFTALYALANLGAYIGFFPLLTILVPLKAQAISPGGKETLLGLTALVGAGVASAANLAAGWLSDHTRSRFGRRRPWVAIGALAAAATYAVVLAARTPEALLFAVALFQLAFNLFFAALAAVLPDRVPDARKGTVAALLSLGPPAGMASGALLAGALVTDEAARYGFIAAAFLAAVAPFVLLVREPRGPEPAPDLAADSPPLRASGRGDFLAAFGSRFFIQVAMTTSQSWLLFFLLDRRGEGALYPDRSAEALLSTLVLIATAASIFSALVGGVLSDRLGRRRVFVALAGVLISAGMATLALGRDWTAALVGQAIYGLGVGLYSAVDLALIAQVLPSRARTARDLGIMNLGNTLPLAVTPLLALAALGQGGYPALFLVGGAAATAGSLAALGVRAVR